MAKSTQAFTYERGYREIAAGTPWARELTDEEDDDSYVCPPWKEIVTSEGHNEFGINLLRTWPTIYDGTNDPHGVPEWWNPSKEVDVVICGAGPSGLEVALSLVRQGVSFRIIDKAEGPLIAGRADGVQPRFLEILNSWGLAQEVHEEGPLIERTAIYKDGKKLFFNRSHQSDSRYRGLHIVTQGQIERIYIRDLLRHRMLVERSSTLSNFSVEEDGGTHPVRVTIQNQRTGKEEEVRAKFLVGSDGGTSKIRKSLAIPFDGISTDIYWGIMDCIYETDYPHAWNFGSVISSEHGGCVIIPREDGYIRLYTQLDVSYTGPIAASRQARDPTFVETGGKVSIHSITPEEVLEQTNKIFAPYKVRFGAPLSWFTIWKISERVARSFSSKDQRVHLVGDAAHVHSVMGAFGLNASIMDACNLAWKMGLVCKEKASVDTIMPTYHHERHEQACRIIEVSGEYLRFVCNTSLPIVDLRNPEKGAMMMTDGSSIPAAKDKALDLKFLGSFFGRNGQFLLGIEAPFDPSVITSPIQPDHGALKLQNGVRAPNPRVCFSINETGYLYDRMKGAGFFHLVLFGSNLRGKVRQHVSSFAAKVLGNTKSFYHRYGGSSFFNIVVVLNCLPDETVGLMDEVELDLLRMTATVVFDDRAPDENAHTTYGVNHSSGALVVVRPDLWVGTSSLPDDIDALESYFGAFLLS
ncbi:hypothetical protein M501DRAFT_1007312 [Patellaria atrata CBS 101060]|uniref:FAD-binding domain-containing protein n=1 Tax=Patellaria atrata CBS 101060 TaxID=1346257 RepID=A0A9P4VPD2_9PEZI|nr:hypothetical protein M501DRAFT_1007312 [Patellaria atrata CBS 101060]